MTKIAQTKKVKTQDFYTESAHELQLLKEATISKQKTKLLLMLLTVFYYVKSSFLSSMIKAQVQPIKSWLLGYRKVFSVFHSSNISHLFVHKFLHKRALSLCSLLLLFLFASLNSNAQLEFDAASMAAIPPADFTNSSQTATIRNNTTGTTFVAYTPTAKVTVAYSNQQYTGATAQRPTNNALNFGTPSQNVFVPMDAIGNPVKSSFYYYSSYKSFIVAFNKVSQQCNITLNAQTYACSLGQKNHYSSFKI